MTTPMPETMSPREKVAAVLDPEIWADDMLVPTRADVTDFHARRQASIVKADAILTALASGSGDHAELALGMRAFEGSDELGNGDFTVCEFAADALEALLAENAALKYAVQNGNEHLEFWETRATEAERKLDEAVADERARGQVIINERDKWIVELIRERDAAKAILRNAVSEAIPDAMIFAGHPDEQRYSKALDGLRIWTDRARTFLSKEAERG